MLRTALGLGAAGVVALKGTAELTNPKVLRGSMGAAFRLPAVAADAEDAARLGAATRASRSGWPPPTATPLSRAAPRAPRPPVALVLGNEGAGVGPAVAARGRPAGGDPARRRGSSRSTWRSRPASFCTRSRVTLDAGRSGHSMLVGYAGVFGAVIGSFLNVCILRWGAEPKQSVVRPPSRCPKCGRGLRWYENIPSSPGSSCAAAAAAAASRSRCSTR